MAPLATRASDLEMLDGAELDARELETNLRDLALLDRLPGGTAASVGAINRVLREATGSGELGQWSVLDVGTGGGDVVRQLGRSAAAGRWGGLLLIAADIHPDILAIAARNLARTEGVTLLHADARRLPLANHSVDVAHASLLLHHLDAHGAVEAFTEMRRVARQAVVINDLRRGAVPYLLVAAAVWTLTRGRYTHHDGTLSVRRAYTLPELDELAGAAGLFPAWRSSTIAPRVTTIYRWPPSS